jgi:beta-lactamase regulating signal transducer with metallopeptidase domain
MDNVHSLAAHTLSWLFNYLVHSSILLGCAGLAQYCGALQQRRLAELVWRLALFGGLATASLQLGIQEYWQSPNNNSLTNAPSQIIAPNRSNLAGDSEKLLMRDERVDLTASASPVHNQTVTQLSTNTPSDKATIRLPANLQDLISLMVLIWLSYCALITTKIALNVQHLNRIANAMPIVSRKDLTALLTKALPKRNNAQALRVSTIFNSPFVCPNGIICLPAWALKQENQALCHAMLQHEIRHIVRKDSAWRIAQEFIKTAFFFQVLNRAADKQLTLLAEIDCDYVAVRANGVDTFAQALVRCAEMAVSSKHPSFAIPMAKSTSLLQRIEFILDEDIMNKQTPREHNKPTSVSSLALGLIAIASLSGISYAMPTIGFAEVPIAKASIAPSAPARQEVRKVDAPSMLMPVAQTEARDDAEVTDTIAVHTNDDPPKNHISVSELAVTPSETSATQANEFEKAQAAYANKNFTEALQLFRDLAKRGHTEALYMAGDMLWRGEGSNVDPETAISMLAQAANQGHAKAQQYTALFTERAKRQAEITFYTQQFDGGKLKWSEKICERPIVSSMLPSAKDYKNLIDKVNANLTCYNNYVAGLMQSLANEDYLRADLRHLMRKDEIEQTKQLVQNVYFDMGTQALQNSQQLLVEFNKNNDIWRSEIKAQKGRHIELSMDMERDRFLRMERRPVEIETGVRSVTTSSNPNVAPIVNTK